MSKFGALQFDCTEHAKILLKRFTKFVYSNSIVSLSMAHIYNQDYYLHELWGILVNVVETLNLERRLLTRKKFRNFQLLFDRWRFYAST